MNMDIHLLTEKLWWGKKKKKKKGLSISRRLFSSDTELERKGEEGLGVRDRWCFVENSVDTMDEKDFRLYI